MLNLTLVRTYITDFYTLADGRIAGLLNAGLLSGKVIIPDIEFHEEANAPLVERAKTTVERLARERGVKLQVAHSGLAHEELLNLARKSRALIITADRELKPGDDVAITRLDELYESLKPVYLPGAEIVIKIVKHGKEADEGIGYLEGGIKVVVDNASGLVGKDVEVVIQGALDTAIGRVVFAKPKYTEVR